MGKVKIKNCENCGKVTAEEVKNVNHVLHIILSVLTGGWWAIIYILLLMAPGKFVCKKCGRIIEESWKSVRKGE